MKPSLLLSKIKLYQPLRHLADRLLYLKQSGSEKIKASCYQLTLKRTTKARPDWYVPDVLVVLNCGGIGNAVEATPFVQALRALWPRAVMTVVVPRGDLFQNWCVPDRMTDSPEDIRDRSFDHSFFPYPFLGAIRPWQQVCDLGVIHHPRVWLRKYFIKPERQYAMDMLRPLGYKGLAPPLYVSVKEPRTRPRDVSVRICLAPGGKNEHRWRHKRWLSYGTLIQLLRSTYPQTQICIVGTQEDHLAMQEPVDSQVLDLRGRLTLAETAWVLKTAALAVGNDCGPMHIAYAVGTPSVTIFGPTCPLKNAPCNRGVALRAGTSCGPCQYDQRLETCAQPCCMNELTPQMVMDKVSRLLQQTRSARTV